MLCVEEFIQNNVTKEAKPLAVKISKELSDLLNILKKNGLLRDKISGEIGERRDIIVEAQRNNDAILSSFNKYYAYYFDLEKRNKFIDFMKSNGFNDIDIMHLLHSQLIFAFLSNIEIFKNLFNLILKDSSSKFTIGYLFGKEGLLTKHSDAIANRLNIELRNAFSHYTFTEKGSLLCYYSYKKQGQAIKLIQGSINSNELLEKTLEVSLMKAILGCLIADRYGTTGRKQ